MAFFIKAFTDIHPSLTTRTTAIETITKTIPHNENNHETINQETTTKQLTTKQPNSLTTFASTTSYKITPSATGETLTTSTVVVECEPTNSFGVLIQDPTDCSKFYVCTLDVTGKWIKHEFSCPGILLFNEDLQACDWPFNVACNSAA